MGLDVGCGVACNARSPCPRLHFSWLRTGAFALGLLLLVHIPLGGIATTILVFAVLSLIAYLLMRRVFGLKTGSVKIWDRDIND